MQKQKIKSTWWWQHMVTHMLLGAKNHENSQPSHGSGGIPATTPASRCHHLLDTNCHQLPETNCHSFWTMPVWLSFFVVVSVALPQKQANKDATQPIAPLHHAAMAPWQKSLAVVQNDNNGALHEVQCQCCSIACNRAMLWHGEKCNGTMLHKGTKNAAAQHETKLPVPWPKGNAMEQHTMQLPTPQQEEKCQHSCQCCGMKKHTALWRAAKKKCYSPKSNTMAEEQHRGTRVTLWHKEKCCRHKEQFHGTKSNAMGMKSNAAGTKSNAVAF